jgi:hypothetical protein
MTKQTLLLFKMVNLNKIILHFDHSFFFGLNEIILHFEYSFFFDLFCFPWQSATKIQQRAHWAKQAVPIFTNLEIAQIFLNWLKRMAAMGGNEIGKGGLASEAVYKMVQLPLTIYT